tara:strand:- start:61147 stop:61830 length:684 start_codon:yes stop_codon:yes gene_type:complete
MSTKFLLLVSCYLLTACSATAKLDSANEAFINTDIQAITNNLTRALWREQLQWPKSCDDGVSHITKHVDDFIGVEVYDWLAGQKLLLVTCEIGPYQQGEMFYLETKQGSNKFELIDFLQFKLVEDAPESLMDNKEAALYYQFKAPLLSGKLYVDNDQGIIRNDHFYRGSGGCGVSTTYSLLAPKSEQAVKAEIVSLSTKVLCDENNVAISQWQKHSENEYSTWPVFK